MQPHWRPELGTLITLDRGYEDERYWRVIAGAREELVDGDTNYSIMDWPAFLVDKVTGDVRELSVIGNFDHLDSMKPYGPSPSAWGCGTR